LLLLNQHPFAMQGGRSVVRKLIAFDDETFDKLKQLGRNRMATIQELADEAFADMLKKHGIPIDLKDALRKSASLSKAPEKNAARSTPSRSSRSRKPKS
jgi:non-homologous end joining protein Ku